MDAVEVHLLATRLEDVVQQWKSPIYMGFFQIPVFAPLACRLGLVDALIAAAAYFETGTRPRGVLGHRARDNRAGLNIYTANLLSRLARKRSTTVPVQVAAPARDVFITPREPDRYRRMGRRGNGLSIDGGHWIPLFNPAAIADPVHAPGTMLLCSDRAQSDHLTLDL